MKTEKIKIDILPNYFLKENGTFDKENAFILCGKIAGICYDKEGFKHLENEDEKKTQRRIEMTLNNGHHSVYDHIMINFNIQNIPKILAMVLNNEKEYTTSEKSARYTPVERKYNSIITEEEEKLYNKWVNIFNKEIKSKYSYIYNNSKIQKLSQENARYLITVFMPTQMIYSTSLRQINYIASWMIEYIKNADMSDNFSNKLAKYMKEFINCLEDLNVLDIRLMKNEKHRNISLFGHDLDSREEHFGYVYSTIYDGTFAQVAQAQRHRSLDYQIELNNTKRYYVPPILDSNQELVDEWLHDIESLKLVSPQGELVKIYEAGPYDKFILKCKERLCSSAQLEIMEQTKKTLLKYKKSLYEINSNLINDIENRIYGARCTFKDYDCPSDCNFIEGKKLTRKI